MNLNYTSKTEVVPVSYVTKGKQRLSQYNGSVYLNNGDSFELELFNPTSNKVLAKIELNGNSIGSGIVLRPGERVYLERHLDESKKFIFETYDVDGKNPNVLNAIQKNGNVSVKFYDEYKPPQYYGGGTCYSPMQIYNHTTTYPPTITCTTTTYNSGISSYTSSTGIPAHKKTVHTAFFSSPVMDSIETGRIEKGENSNQSFGYDNSNFNVHYSYISGWKILPISQKPIMKEDLKVFCSSCGRRRRKDTERYCPSCGNKL